MDAAATDDWVAAAQELDAGHRIALDVAIDNGPLALLLDHNAEHFAVVNVTALYEWVAARANEDAGHGIGDQVAIFDRAATSLPDHDSARAALVNATAANDGVGQRAVNGYSRETVRRYVAIFEHELALG